MDPGNRRTPTSASRCPEPRRSPAPRCAWVAGSSPPSRGTPSWPSSSASWTTTWPGGIPRRSRRSTEHLQRRVLPAAPPRPPGALRRGDRDQYHALHLPHDPDHRRRARRQLCGHPDPGPPRPLHPALRPRPRAGVLGARAPGRDDRDTLRHRELQPVGLPGDGEPAAAGGARDARRLPGVRPGPAPCLGVPVRGPVARVGVPHGGDLGPGGGPVWRAGVRGRPYLREQHEERRAGVPLSVRILDRDDRGAHRRRALGGNPRGAAQGGEVDRLGQENGGRADSGHGGVLLREGGASMVGLCVFASLRPRVQAAVALVILSAAPAAAQFDAGIPVGSKAPAVTINDLDGKPVDLGTVLGKKAVLLEFWATWCPLCKALLPQLGRVRDAFGDRVELIGVNVTVNHPKHGTRRPPADPPPPFRVLFDEKGAGARAYDVPGTSFVVVVDPGGKVVYTGSGEDQDLVAAVRRALPNP